MSAVACNSLSQQIDFFGMAVQINQSALLNSGKFLTFIAACV